MLFTTALIQPQPLCVRRVRQSWLVYSFSALQRGVLPALQVACYKICTVKLNRTQSDDDDDAAETLDSEEAIVRSVMRNSSQGSLDQRCAAPTALWS